VLATVADALMKLITDVLAVETRIDVDTILSTVTAAVAEQVPVTCVAILMKTDPGNSRVVVADSANPEMASYTEEYVSTLFRPDEAPTTGLSQSVIESGAPLFMPGVEMDQYLSLISPEGRTFYATHPVPIAIGPITFLMVPMHSGPAIVGTLGLCEWRSRDVLTEADVEWVQKVADRTGLTIDNAQLRNRALDRIERLSALGDAALAITSSQDLRMTLKLILERLIAGLGVDAADLLLVDEADGSMYVAASAGFRSSSPPDSRFPIPAEAERRALFGRRVMSAGAIEWLGHSRRWLVAREGLKTYAAAPLMVRERFIGALEIFSRSNLDPDDDWLAFLDAMARHAAIGVDNATMYDELHRVGYVHVTRRIPAPVLSDREREILRLVVEGASNRDVAGNLHLSHNTIKFHVRQLLEKAGVSNRTELATKAVQHGWL
jgi:DNA-binding CsgD family transcriptional regulator/GAF domain-containing protein